MKKTIIVDGTVFCDGIMGMGTGIYYSSVNILEEFLKRQDIQVVIFYNKKYKYSLYKFLTEKYDYPFVFYPEFSLKDRWVGRLLDKRVQCKKQKKVICSLLLGLAKDILRICLPNGKYQIKNFDFAFSMYHAFDENLVKAEKQFYFLHDAIPVVLGNYAKEVSSWFVETEKIISSDFMYFANSQNTKQDFLKIFPQLKQEQITVTPLAAKDGFRKITDKHLIAEVRKKYHIPENKKYVFSLCTLEPRKNLLRAVKTFVEFVRKNQIDDMVFVLGGGSWKDFIVRFEKELGKLPENLIYRAGYVAEEDLPALYSGAEWFVYTSQYEGFGLPPLEAMQCGCPVITSNNSSLPEVVGDAGIMIDFDSDGQHIKAYETYYYDRQYRENMGEKGLERSKLFSWKKTADLILAKMLEETSRL